MSQSQEPQNLPDKRKSRSRRGSYDKSPKQPPPPPFWKNILINLLRGISGFSEAAAVKLETQKQSETSKNVSIWQNLQLLGNELLSKIRGIFPGNLPVKLPNLAWIGILTTIVAIAIWAISSLFTAKPSKVVDVTPTQENPLPTTEQELEVKPTPVPKVIPTPSTEEKSIPQPEINPTPSIEEKTLPQPEIIPTPSTEEKSLPESEVTPTPTPSKKIVLTPEQTLIAAIENKVAEISDRFASGLIQSIQANFRTSSLTIIIGDEWYDLPISEQRKLATEMLQRSQELDFSHLEIVDVQKRLLARNPVVGTEMIIFTPIVKKLPDSVQ
ncbi:hypothetical protein [Calothrix rhizosoleniae]|uniref:hypothetical protein n=1 Tax=Calothrix rhizosoleniae TaxID=888997 RepID=UPI000B49A28E|nr:hypothetical protein [Calothrix rhizosoleniae]